MSSSAITNSTAGLDVQSTVDRLMYAERAPERLLQQQQDKLSAEEAIFEDINAKLKAFEQRVQDLRDLDGAINSRTVTSSNAQVITATAEAGAAAGLHTVTVERLATVSSWYSTSTTISEGSSFDIKVGDGPLKTISFDASHTTLESAAAYINSLELGVTANVINDANGARLTLVSRQSGAPGDIAISNDSTGLGLSTSIQGQNAKLTVDGVPIESATNTITGVIPGLSLNLTGQAPGAQIALKVAPDKARVSAAINDFVSIYNSIIKAINAQFAYDPTTQKAGVLAGDSTLRNLQSRLLGDMSYSTSSGRYTSLASLGIEMENEGTLTVNNSELDDALTNHYGDVQSFLQGTVDGFASRLGEDLMAMTDTVDGPVSLALTGIDATSKTISDQIDELEVRYKLREQQLFEDYSRVDLLLRQLPALQNQIATQLESLKTK